MRAYRRRRFSIEPIKHDAGRTVERNVHHAILDLHIFDMSANSQPHAGSWASPPCATHGIAHLDTLLS